MTTEHLAILIGVLQAADAATTLYFLKHTTLQEANPLLRRLFDIFGPAQTLLVSKGLLAAAIWYWHAAIPVESLWLIVVVYVGVVAWNFKHILRVREAAQN